MKVLEFLFAVIFGLPLLIAGFIFEIVQILRLKLRFFKTVFRLILEILKEIYNFFEVLAIFIDKIGNIVIGKLFEFLFINKSAWNLTLFQKANITISASFGQALKYRYLNKKGVKFVKLLDKVLGKNHCKSSYEFYIIKKKFNQKK
jgi:hypothetical protein